MSKKPPQYVEPLMTNQAYICTMTPEKLVAAIIIALQPYEIDNAHGFAVFKILQSAIVTPQLPPSARFKPKRQRKSEYRSTHPPSGSSTGPSQAQYGQDRPIDPYWREPTSVNESFCLHHSDPRFTKRFPHAVMASYGSPKAGEQVVEKDTRVPSEHRTTSQPTASSPSLSTPPANTTPIAEANDDVERTQDAEPTQAVEPTQDVQEVIQIQAKEEEQTVLNSIETDNTMSGGVPPHQDADEAPQAHDIDEGTIKNDQSSSTEDASAEDSGIVLEDSPMIDREPPADVHINPLDAQNHSTPPLDPQDTFDEIQQDNTVTTQLEPSTQHTDSAYGTQTSDAQPQEHNDVEQPPVPRRRKIAKAAPVRRSLRIAKQGPESQPTASSLGKRSRESDATNDESARKKSKT
ncbi:uncharacterized protein K460DRAFT_409595 [Cucurbitaria berberidis CBS 394.84]|uniref:Uncharacterized protein n=1 Tax=Cucurbitaria berberidis CBS 394.84 TaxID=1168544 RepID=A0A9P4GAR9_9PLEO|nr:uncharacterized protein K460DRAFT_409595 [Cucurbitaria berberidis CBS 394.84]KAF1842177.1 hypothetical protein K460DRAFT_409595 [Cucurbitaria berberidis CBS 394.84]